MKAINYKFADRTSCDVEVSEEFFAEYTALVDKERLCNRKETRRHKSLDYFADKGLQLKSTAPTPLDILVQKELLDSVLDILTDYQRKIAILYYIEKLKQKEIAVIMGVSATAINKILKKIQEKLKNFVKGVYF